MSRTVLYLTAESTLTPGDYYQRNGVTPIVILKGHGENLYRYDWNWAPSVGLTAAKVKGPWHAALWCQNNVPGPLRGGGTLFPWDLDAAWNALLSNLKRLSALLPPASGIFFDGEIYSATPGGSGGLMDKRAWPAGDKAAKRGEQVREVVGDRPLGQYVLVSDAKRHTGWRQFWSGAYRPGDLLLDESGYLKHFGARKATAFTRTVRNLPGRTIINARLEPARVPAGDFWIWPQGETAGLLEKVSAKWK